MVVAEDARILSQCPVCTKHTVCFSESHLVEIEKRWVSQTTFFHVDGHECVQILDLDQ